MNGIELYLHKTFGVSANVKQMPDLLMKKLPLYLRNSYYYSILELNGRSFVLVENKQGAKAVGQIKNQKEAIVRLSGFPVVFVLYNQNTAQRRKMIENRISFIVPESQVYLPELLIYLDDTVRPSSVPPELLTPSSQLLLLYHLQRESLDKFSFKEIAKKLNYSPKTVTKIAAELKAKKVCRTIGTKEKRFLFEAGRKELWQMVEPQMQSPIIKNCFVEKKENMEFCKSGDMALSHYTFLSDTGKEEYAIYKNRFEELIANNYWSRLDEVEGDVQIQMWRYDPCLLSADGYIDPLSLNLCYREDTNERVEAEIKELINKKIWLED